ncbi:MAG: hypothetical protein IJ566_01595 [Cardiobacteriaceae bacterium]|nr:hypothetical protein [Cardiobacteriaceae bacterium]
MSENSQNHWLKFILNPSLLICILTIPAVFWTAKTYGGSQAVIVILVALILYILLSWYTSTRPVAYNRPAICMWDIASDVFAYTVNTIFCVVWVFCAKDFLPPSENISLYYFIILGFLILMNIATLIEMMFSIFNSLRAMYLINPVHISKN